MTERDTIYLQILRFGLGRLRDSAELGLIEYCAIESEHLHNIPSLVEETNELRHRFYFDQERTYYLERVDQSTPGLDSTMNIYTQLWARLKEINEVVGSTSSHP
jgi:hypothetical protein